MSIRLSRRGHSKKCDAENVKHEKRMRCMQATLNVTKQTKARSQVFALQINRLPFYFDIPFSTSSGKL